MFLTGGGGEIRTHGPIAGSAVFKTAALIHSATPPTNYVALMVADTQLSINYYLIYLNFIMVLKVGFEPTTY